MKTVPPFLMHTGVQMKLSSKIYITSRQGSMGWRGRRLRKQFAYGRTGMF